MFQQPFFSMLNIASKPGLMMLKALYMLGVIDVIDVIDVICLIHPFIHVLCLRTESEFCGELL